MFYHINFIGIIVAAIVYMICGWAWYSKYLFGARWMRLMNWITNDSSSEERAARKATSNRAMYFNVAIALILAFVLERIIYNVPLVTIPNTIFLSILIWLGFTAATNSTEYIYNSRGHSWELFLINQVFFLLMTLIMTFILLFIGSNYA